MPTEGLTVSGISFLEMGPKSRGLSGEHIQLCAEGARRNAESLRQMDGDANKKACYGALLRCAGSPLWAAFLFGIKLKEGYVYVHEAC